MEQHPTVDRGVWFRSAMSSFPELDRANYDPDDPAQPASICEELAYLADEAHRSSGSEEFLSKCYWFMRWSIRRVEDAQLLGCIADWFFDRILQLPNSKSGCVEYLDWGDVSMLMENFTTEPSFEDVANFNLLCTKWKKRWARNQKLPPPVDMLL